MSNRVKMIMKLHAVSQTSVASPLWKNWLLILCFTPVGCQGSGNSNTHTRKHLYVWAHRLNGTAGSNDSSSAWFSEASKTVFINFPLHFPSLSHTLLPSMTACLPHIGLARILCPSPLSIILFWRFIVYACFCLSWWNGSLYTPSFMMPYILFSVIRWICVIFMILKNILRATLIL